jgi:hypothetical protein
MTARRLIAAVVSTVALLAVNVGIADSAAAKGSAWGITSTSETKAKPAGSAWG